VPLGSTLRLDPGDYRLILHSADGHDRTLPITLHPSESKEVVAEPPASSAPEERRAAPPAALAPPPADTADARANHRQLGYVLGGVGLALLAVGTATGIIVGVEAGTYKQYCANGCNSTGAQAASVGRTLGVVSPVTLALGAVGTGLGAYFVLTSPRGQVTMSARPASGGTVVDLGIAF
jgi:hypothetical protein